MSENKKKMTASELAAHYRKLARDVLKKEKEKQEYDFKLIAKFIKESDPIAWEKFVKEFNSKKKNIKENPKKDEVKKENQSSLGFK